MLNFSYRTRADWFLILAGIALVFYYQLVYRPLSQESDQLDQSIRNLADQVGGTNVTRQAGEPLNLSTITNRLETFQHALARLNAQRKDLQQRVTIGEEFQTKLREPFQFIDFLNEKQQRTDQLARLAQKQKVDLAPSALAGFPEYTGENRQPSLLWAQLAIVNRLVTAAILAQPKSIEAVYLPPIQAHRFQRNGRQENVLLDEIPARIELVGPAEVISRFLNALVFPAEQLRLLDEDEQMAGRPGLFIDRFILRKNSRENPHEVHLDLVVSGFVPRG